MHLDDFQAKVKGDIGAGNGEMGGKLVLMLLANLGSIVVSIDMKF